MNDEKMDTHDQDFSDPRACDPLSETDPASAEQECGFDLAIPDEGPNAPPVADAPADPALSADPLSDPDSDPSPDPATDAEAGIEQLRDELNQLRAALAAKDRFWERLGSECEEFGALYPNTPLSSVPDAVWSDVQRGIPLAAAYAIAEKRRLYTEALAKQSNAENQNRSTGALDTANADYYTPGEVRAMSARQVRDNYQKIMQSMQRWH